jgi:hypothetical protein
MPHIRGRWEGVTLGTWTDEDGCTCSACIRSITTVWDDDTWERVGYDPDDPLSQYVERSSDPGNTTTAEQLLSMYRAFMNTNQRVASVLAGISTATFIVTG